MDEWKTDKTNIPKDGSICEIIISDTGKGLGLVCAVIINGRFMLNGLDITDNVLRWHKIPNIIAGPIGYIQWDR